MKNRIPRLALVLGLACATGCMTESYLRRGDAAFAAGRPEEALRYYEQVHRRSSKHRSDPAFESKMRQTRVQALIVQGRRDMGSRQWDAALAKLREALELDASSVSARELIDQAKRGAADSALAAACRLADQGRLAEAGQECTRGLGYEPGHGGLAQAQQSLSPQAPAQTELAQAAVFTKEQRWAEADGILRRVLESHPYHLPARNRRAAVQSRLDEERRLFQVVESLVREGDLARGEATLGELLRGSPHHVEARALLAKVRERLAQGKALMAEAEQAERRDRPGLALQRLYEAREIWPKGVRSADVARIEGILRELYPVRLIWDAQGRGAESLRSTLAAQLGTGTRREVPDAYRLTVQVDAPPGRIEALQGERLQHRYVVRETIPNPDIPALRRELARREAEEHGLRRRFDDAVREQRMAERRIPENDPSRESTLRRLDGSVRQAERELREGRQRTERAAHALRSAPPVVVLEQTQIWPYVRQTMRKILTVSARAELSFAGQRVGRPTEYARSATSDDVMTENANPGLGLPEDLLDLASDEELAAGAGELVARDIAAWALATVREAWASHLQASANALEQQGEGDDALELRMAAQAYRKLAGR